MPACERWQLSVGFRALRLLSQRGTAGGAVPRSFLGSGQPAMQERTPARGSFDLGALDFGSAQRGLGMLHRRAEHALPGGGGGGRTSGPSRVL